MRFVPADLEIRAGDVVRWEQSERCPVNHFLEIVAVDDDAEVHVAESSDVLTPANPWRHKFDVPGEYHYRSLVHTYMKGTVRVAPRILGSLKADPADPYEFVDETDEVADVVVDVSAVVAADVDEDEDGDEDEEETGNDAEYSLLPSGDEDDEDRVEDPRRTLPTAAEADAKLDELIAVMSAGGNNDKLETLEKSFGSMELLTSGKGMAGLDAMRRRRMTMGASDRGDADIWRGRPPKKESPTFKSMITPPPEAVQRALDECRREADSTERVKAAMKAMGRMDQPASGLIGLPEVYQKVQASVAGGAWEFGEEFALDVLVADGDTFKCRCGKPFAAAMNATRHVASGQCMWNKDDRKKKKKDLKKNKDRGPAATKEQLAAFLVAMSPQARVDFFKSIGTDRDGREWQTKWLVLRAIKNRHEDHFLTGFHPEKIWGPGESLQRHFARVRRAIERLGIFDGDKHLNGSADIVGEAVKVFHQYAANCAVLRDYIEDPDQARDMDAADLSKLIASIDAVSEETFLSSGKYGGAVDNPDAMCAGINQEAALAYMTEVALVNAYVAARSAEAEAEQRKLLAELDEAAADEERREARRAKEKAKKAKAKANKKKGVTGVESSPEPAAAASAAEKEKDSEADFEKDDDDRYDDRYDEEEEEAERAREKERAEAEAEAARIARRRAAEAAAEAAELAEKEARELAAAERRLEMEMAARDRAKAAAEEEATRRRSGEFDPPGVVRSIAGGGLLGVMANGVVASPYGKARPKKPSPNQPGSGKPPQRPNAAASTEASADAVAKAQFVPPLPPGPPPAAAAAGRSPEGKPQATTAAATTTTATSPAARAQSAAPVVKPRPAPFDPSKQPTRASPTPVVSSASVAAPGSSRHPGGAGRGKGGYAGTGVKGGGYGSATGTGVNSGTGASSLSESDYRSSDAESGGTRARPSRRDRAVARAAAKAEAAQRGSGRESGNSSQSEQKIDVYRRDAPRDGGRDDPAGPGPAKSLSEVEGMLLAAAERTEAQARRARAAAEEAEVSLRSKEKARLQAAAEEERRARREEAEARKSAAAAAAAAASAAAPKVKYCTQCGERQTEGARFCSGCGVPLAKPADADDDAASSPPATAPAPPPPPPPPPYAHYPAPPPPPYAGYPGGAPGVPPVDLGAEYSALYLQHYHAALAAITAQQQQQYAQGHYAGAYPGGYPAYDPHAAHPYGATAAPGAPPPPPPVPRGPPPRES